MKLNKLLLNEMVFLLIAFILIFLMMKIVFFKENFFVVIKIISALFYLFVLPGYFAMLFWLDKLDFKERLLIGTGAGAAFLGITSYLLGLLGIDIFVWAIFCPLLIILVSLFMNYRKIIEMQ